MPGVDDEVADVGNADWPPQDVSKLCVCVAVGGSQWRDIDGVSDRLVTGRVDHVAERLLSVLDTSTFRIPVP